MLETTKRLAEKPFKNQNPVLQDRTQTGPHITKRTVTSCEVPQGSVFGPKLFLLYINYICSCSTFFFLLMLLISYMPIKKSPRIVKSI